MRMGVGNYTVGVGTPVSRFHRAVLAEAKVTQQI